MKILLTGTWKKIVTASTVKDQQAMSENLGEASVMNLINLLHCERSWEKIPEKWHRNLYAKSVEPDPLI